MEIRYSGSKYHEVCIVCILYILRFSDWPYRCRIGRFLVVDTQLYKRLCPSVGPSVGPLVRGHWVEKWENKHFWYFLCLLVCWRWVGVWLGVRCPCPPVRNDIVTPRHLFFFLTSRRFFVYQIPNPVAQFAWRREEERKHQTVGEKRNISKARWQMQ